ncbi:hypothetical protein ACFQH3_06050 [Haladaptatus sp. GCM10025707]|uniref:hypothetical protein n=1 Tax=unclassified Haladaptatus TaxID=2622732 RepID=UPI003617AD04
MPVTLDLASNYADAVGNDHLTEPLAEETTVYALLNEIAEAHPPSTPSGSGRTASCAATSR